MNQSMKSVLIVSDMDGTFLGAKSETLPRNVEAIHRLQEMGGHFTFATGRGLREMLLAAPLAKELCNAPLILQNGTVLYDLQKEELLWEKTFPTDHTFWSLLWEIAARYPRLCFHIHTAEPNRYLHGVDPMPTEIGYCRKIVLDHPYDEKEAALQTMEKILKDRYPLLEYNYSCERFLELLPHGGTKGDAIQSLRHACGDTPMTVFAVGDYGNDLNMLKKADFAACPSNAIDEVKAVCQYHLCHHSEGAIADLIEKILQEREE